MQRSKNLVKKYESTTLRAAKPKRRWLSLFDIFDQMDGFTERYEEIDVHEYENPYSHTNGDGVGASSAESPAPREADTVMYDIDANGEEFQSMNFSCLKITSCTFRYTDLEGADFRMSEIILSDLHGANCRSATFAGAEVSFTDLSNINFSNADLEGCKFESCDMSHSDLCGANLTNCEFVDVNLFDCLYDERSKLPFTRAEAQELGMRMVAAPVIPSAS